MPHPDPDIDLCAMPIASLLQEAESSGRSVFHFPLDRSLIPIDAELQDFDLLEEITMVGYPNGLWDKKNQLIGRSLCLKRRVCHCNSSILI